MKNWSIEEHICEYHIAKYEPTREYYCEICGQLFGRYAEDEKYSLEEDIFI